MNGSNKAPLVIAFVVVVVLFLIFGGGAINAGLWGGVGGEGRGGGGRGGGTGGGGGVFWGGVSPPFSPRLGALLGVGGSSGKRERGKTIRVPIGIPAVDLKRDTHYMKRRKFIWSVLAGTAAFTSTGVGLLSGIKERNS